MQHSFDDDWAPPVLAQPRNVIPGSRRIEECGDVPGDTREALRGRTLEVPEPHRRAQQAKEPPGPASQVEDRAGLGAQRDSKRVTEVTLASSLHRQVDRHA
jgi:hypothetical protein